MSYQCGFIIITLGYCLSFRFIRNVPAVLILIVFQFWSTYFFSFFFWNTYFSVMLFASIYFRLVKISWYILSSYLIYFIKLEIFYQARYILSSYLSVWIRILSILCNQNLKKTLDVRLIYNSSHNLFLFSTFKT